jgi:hypothetical protein
MGYNHQHTAIKSRTSFVPLIRTWEKIVQTGRVAVRERAQQWLNTIAELPELMQPVDSEEVLKRHQSTIEKILSGLFPVTLSDEQDIYAVLQPFNQQVLYASSLFRQIFMEGNNDYVNAPKAIAGDIDQDKICGAYQLILNQVYHVQVEGEVSSIHHFSCPKTHLDKYVELTLDPRFIDVVPEADLPQLPLNNIKELNVYDILKNDALLNQLPLEKFRFDGFVIIRIKEVTEREIINKIKNKLLDLHSFTDEKIFVELNYQMQNLAGIHQLETAIKPFFMVNNHLVLSEIVTTNKTAKSYPFTEEQQYALYQNIDAVFKASPENIVVSDITEETVMKYPFLYVLHENKFKSVIIAPLFKQQHLLGILIITHRTESLNHQHLAKIQPAIPLFAIAIEKSQESLDHHVDKIIREQFTAVQEAVEWRFTKAALNYLTKKDQPEGKKIEPIVFDHVFPLYAAIDIRNSSIERNNAIQLDLLEQLQMAGIIIGKAKSISNFPLLDELQFRIQRFIDSVSKILFAEEETAVHDFLTTEITGVMNHLKSIMPQLEKDIDNYHSLMLSPVRMLYHHRRQYEESIMRINAELAMLVDHEQIAAQSIYPHYFERFVTDGLDFNIYIGQSIAPRITFNEFYLKNLKIWQLTTLVKAARLAQALEKELPLPLRTTQLILAHSMPISISFKTVERKFDVDGAYNIRYEIMKKRIDKVRINDSNERLTQPGTVAIVYSQNKEAQEYLSYIEFLQSKKLLNEKVEKLELEELQGISGLKGLRAYINYECMEEERNVAKEEQEPAVLMPLLSQL